MTIDVRVSASKSLAARFVTLIEPSRTTYRLSHVKALSEQLIARALGFPLSGFPSSVWISQVDLLNALIAAGYRVRPDGTDHLVGCKARVPGGAVDRALRAGSTDELVQTAILGKPRRSPRSTPENAP